MSVGYHPRCRTSDDPIAPATDDLVIDTVIPMSIVTEGMHIRVHKLGRSYRYTMDSKRATHLKHT